MNKLIPKQTESGVECRYDNAKSKLAEFMKITGFPYRADDKISQHVNSLFENAFSRWVLEGTKDKMAGFGEPIEFSLKLPQ